ncbi:MAG TPA: hypothetical protein VIT64_04445 [Ilumatobacteraceae bacterium]
MTPPQAGAMLRKRDVEALLDRFDDDPLGALTVALRRVLGRPEATWLELLDAAPMSPERRQALAAADQDALDELARELNELRTLDP